MAVRTGLQPRRRRGGAGDITRGNPFRDLTHEETLKRVKKKVRKGDIKRSRRLIKKMLKEPTTGDPERRERAIRSGVSEGISEEGVKIDFKPRNRPERRPKRAPRFRLR
ncbi:hypothetical protein LCGC14_2853610 [marine sediment metagenome]|uniref:Uncharacterized protein n=1 Tax=marine sediment metagenome TaxID=412755 RepID=A0A0F8Y7X4_9ZZZZ